MKSFVRDIIGTIVTVVVVFLLLQFSIQSSIVIGPSMEPTLKQKQRVLINKLVYTFHPPERGDIIVFHPPNNNQPDYIKRLIALPGDTVEIEDGDVYINNIKLHEPYVEDSPHYSMDSRVIPENNYFVLGDNRNNSNDSHNGWTIPRQNIIGKGWLSLWPPGEWGLVPNHPLAEQLALAAPR